MVRFLKRSHSFTCTPHVHPQCNEPYLPLPSQPKLVLIYRQRRDGRLSWPWVTGWLHTEISVWHRELNPDTVAHLSTNRVRRRLTSLIEANALTTTPDHQSLCKTNCLLSVVSCVYVVHIPSLVVTYDNNGLLYIAAQCWIVHKTLKQQHTLLYTTESQSACHSKLIETDYVKFFRQ